MCILNAIIFPSFDLSFVLLKELSSLALRGGKYIEARLLLCV